MDKILPLQQDFALGIHQRFITLKQDKQYGKRKEENMKGYDRQRTS